MGANRRNAPGDRSQRGSAFEDPREWRECPLCAGQGSYVHPKYRKQDPVCSLCTGIGSIPLENCRTCGSPAVAWLRGTKSIFYCGKSKCWDMHRILLSPERLERIKRELARTADRELMRSHGLVPISKKEFLDRGKEHNGDRGNPAWREWWENHGGWN